MTHYRFIQQSTNVPFSYISLGNDSLLLITNIGNVTDKYFVN